MELATTHNQQAQQAGDEHAHTTSYLLVRLGGETYAIQAARVEELARWTAPTPVPGAPPALMGIINQRGVVLPVININLLLGLAETAPVRSTRVIVAHHEDVQLGLLVDAVIDLMELPDALREPVVATLSAQGTRLLQAMIRWEEHLIGVLELGAVISAVREGL
jgi:purine-binding chemotaxis protein CheW